MSDVTAEELLPILHRYYPAGPPARTASGAAGPEPQPLTPEFQRWQEVWRKALEETRPWSAVFQGLRPLFPGQELASLTQPYHASCFVCGLRLRTPATEEGRGDPPILRVAGAVSLLAPVYLVYGTIELPHLGPDERRRRTRRAVKSGARPGASEPRLERSQQELAPRPQLCLQPTEEMRASAGMLAQHLELALGYRRFPPELADVRVPGLRVPYLGQEEEPTLLTALFKPGLEYL